MRYPSYFIPFHKMHLMLKDDAQNALPFILKSISLYSSGTSRNDTLLYLSYFAKGTFFKDKGLQNQSLIYLRQALNIGSRLNTPLGWENLQSDLARLYFEKGNYDEALHYYTDILPRIDHINDVRLVGAVYNNTARCFANKEPQYYKLAYKYYNKSLETYKTINDSLNIAAVHLNLGDLYFEQYQDQLAITHFNKALSYAKTAKALDIRDDIYYNLSLAMESSGDLEKALDFYKQYVEIQENIWDRDNVWKLAEQEKKFIVDKKEDEIKLLEKDAILQKTLLESRKLQIITFILISFALSIIVIISVYAYKQGNIKNHVIKTQNDKLQDLNQTKDRLFSIIAHDLRSPMLTLKESSVRLKKALSENNDSAADIVNTNIRMAEQTYYLLDNLLYWSLDQKQGLSMYKECQKLSRLTDQVYLNYKEVILHKDIMILYDIDKSVNICVDSNSFKIAIRNLLDNAIKFTPVKGIIKLYTIINNNSVELIIEDNGIGMSKEYINSLFNIHTGCYNTNSNENKSTGLGLELCKSMIEKNGGSLTLESATGKGTKAIITLQLIP